MDHARPAQGATPGQGADAVRLSARLLCALVGLTLLLAVPPVDAAPPSVPDSEFTALFIRYYSAVKKGRWDEALGLLHERLKKAINVQTPKELAVRDVVAQQNLIDGFRRYDNLEVAKTEVDLTSIKGAVTASGDGNVAGQVVYDLVVFPARAGPSTDVPRGHGRGPCAGTDHSAEPGVHGAHRPRRPWRRAVTFPSLTLPADSGYIRIRGLLAIQTGAGEGAAGDEAPGRRDPGPRPQGHRLRL